MRKTLLSASALCALFAGIAHADEKEFPATLESQAVLPANTIIKAPENAPEYLQTSGKFTTPDRKRADRAWQRARQGRRAPHRPVAAFRRPAGPGLFRHQERR